MPYEPASIRGESQRFVQVTFPNTGPAKNPHVRAGGYTDPSNSPLYST